MSTYTQIIYQIVFGTKKRQKVLDLKRIDKLYAYIVGILREKNCFVYRIGGTEDHIHIVCHLHPMVSLASLIKDIKLASNKFIYKTGLFPGFTNWAPGYGAFTYHINAKERLIAYVKNQQEHHRKRSSTEELKALLEEHGVKYDDKYLA
jgi:REP element-mobilizing transposase RayT